jgi:RNA polymerase sigma-B factor
MNKNVGYSLGLELLIAYSRNPSLKLRNQLVQINAGLVRKIAHQVSQQCAEPYEDLQQMGYLGLIRAIERFEPHHGAAFSSFAIPYIRGEMLHYLRDKGSVLRVPRRWQELHAKAKNLRKTLTENLGRLPKEIELAAALGVSLQEWNECQLAVQNRLPLSLDAMISPTTDCSMTVEETLADPRSQLLQKLTEDRLQLQSAMSQLEEKTKAAIEFVFLRDLPRKEAAKRIGISPMTVTRHLQKGIQQLELLLQAQVA